MSIRDFLAFFDGYSGENPKRHAISPKDDSSWHLKLVGGDENRTASDDNTFVGPFPDKAEAEVWSEAHSHLKYLRWKTMEGRTINPGTIVYDPPEDCAIVSNIRSDSGDKFFCLTCNK